MLNRSILAAVCCLPLWLAPVAHAATETYGYSGKDVYAWCIAKDEFPYNTGLCSGFIAGMWAMMEVDVPTNDGVAVTMGETLRVCVPSSVTRPEIERIFIDYLGAHLDEQHFPAVTVMIRALRETHPC